MSGSSSRMFSSSVDNSPPGSGSWVQQTEIKLQTAAAQSDLTGRSQTAVRDANSLISLGTALNFSTALKFVRVVPQLPDGCPRSPHLP